MSPASSAAAAAVPRDEAGLVEWTSALVVAGLAVASLVLAFEGGGASLNQLLPVGVALGMGLLVLAAGGVLGAMPSRRWPGWTGMGATIALALLSVTSLAWTESKSLTTESVAGWVVAALALVLAANACRGVRLALLGVLAVVAVSTVVALVTVIHLLQGQRSLVFSSRLAYPIDYPNGTAALLLIGVPAALALAALQAESPLRRSVFAGIAGLLAATAALTGSRGGALGAILALIVLALLARDRIRLLWTGAAVLAGPVVSSPLLFRHPESHQLRAHGIGVLLAAAISFGCAFAVLRSEPRLYGLWAERRVRLVAWVGVAVVVVALLGAVTARSGAPWSIARHGWHSFTTYERTHNQTVGQHLSSAESDRYEYWRVAYDTWHKHPLLGIGAGAFAIPWYEHRRLPEHVTDPHGWPFKLASEEGLVGLAFYLVFIGSLVAAALACRRRGGLDAVVGAAAAGSTTYFLAHSGVDWLFSIGSVLVVGQLAAGTLLGASAPAATGFARTRLHVGAAVLAVAALVVLLPLWVSFRYVSAAEDQSDPGRAIALLHASRDWSPYAISPLEVEAEIRAEAGDTRGAEAVTRQAIRLEPDRWEPWLQLSRLLSLQGRAEEAAKAHDEAARRNPIDLRQQYQQG